MLKGTFVQILRFQVQNRSSSATGVCRGDSGVGYPKCLCAIWAARQNAGSFPGPVCTALLDLKTNELGKRPSLTLCPYVLAFQNIKEHLIWSSITPDMPILVQTVQCVRAESDL